MHVSNIYNLGDCPPKKKHSIRLFSRTNMFTFRWVNLLAVTVSVQTALPWNTSSYIVCAKNLRTSIQETDAKVQCEVLCALPPMGAILPFLQGSLQRCFFKRRLGGAILPYLTRTSPAATRVLLQQMPAGIGALYQEILVWVIWEGREKLCEQKKLL